MPSLEVINPNRPEGEPAVKAVDHHDYNCQLKSGPSEPSEYWLDLPPFIRLQDDGSYQSGITDEQLIEILIDRTEYFQTKLPCEENLITLQCLREGLRQKHERTARRRKAGVEGTHNAIPA